MALETDDESSGDSNYEPYENLDWESEYEARKIRLRELCQTEEFKPEFSVQGMCFKKDFILLVNLLKHKKTVGKMGQVPTCALSLMKTTRCSTASSRKLVARIGNELCFS